MEWASLLTIGTLLTVLVNAFALWIINLSSQTVEGFVKKNIGNFPIATYVILGIELLAINLIYKLALVGVLVSIFGQNIVGGI